MQLFILTLFLILFTLGTTQAERRLPNIIVIMADDLGYGDLSPYRKGAPRTPSCERLAAEGMKFTDAHSPSSVCTPTRYSLLTGEYAWRSYLQDWVLSERMPLLIEEGTPTLPAMLRKKAYTTACIGKWHLGFGREMDAYQRSDFSIGPNTVGFDYFFGVPFSHNSSPEMEVFMENDRIVGLPEGKTIWEPHGLIAARRSLENTAGDLSNAAVHFIRENQEKPFFLYYATTNVHFPITPHAAFRMGNRGDDFEGLYDGFVAEFDWAVGEVLQTIDRTDLFENTIVIVTSDNGGSLRFGASNDPWFGTKAQIYEAGHRVPMIVRWPERVESASECSTPVTLADLYATFAEITETPLPVEEAIDSVSLLPLLLGKDAPELSKRPIIHHSIAGTFAVRQGDWKFVDGTGSGTGKFSISLKDEDARVIRNADGSYEPFSFQPVFPKSKPEDPNGQLFDLSSDPKEQRNLYNENPEIVFRMTEILEEIKATTVNLFR